MPTSEAGSIRSAVSSDESGIPTGECHPRLARWTKSIRKSSLQEMLLTATRPGTVSFALGLPAPELFPAAALAKAAVDVLGHDPSALQYAPSLASLKRHIVEIMSMRGVACREAQIFLTAGAQQGMSLLARLLLNPGDKVIAEELIYTGFQQAIEPAEPCVLTVPTDRLTGMDVDAVELLLSSGERPAFIYSITDGHNPVGVSMSLDKRVRLVELARRYEVPIMEDDAYGFLSYDSAPLPPLRGIDPRWVLYIGSFSKILAPNLRIGWLIVPESLMDNLSIVKEGSDIDTATFSQRTVAAYLEGGHLPGHLRTLRAEYARRRAEMISALQEHFPPGIRWSVPSSGVFIWVNLGSGVDTSKLLKVALEKEKIAFIPGRAFEVRENHHAANCLRLNFSNCPASQITDGIMRLARLVKAEMA
jgi:2-aminoadipate transaminase